LHLLGIVAYRTQHHEYTIRLIQQAIIYQPALLDAYYNLATLFKELGNYQESIEYYEKGLSLEFNLGCPFDLEKLVIFLCQSTLSAWHERQEHLVNYGHCLYQAGNLQKRASLLLHIAHHLKRNYLHSSIF
jgi:tetratricopeptide (TPR) repeat protein